MLPKNTSEMESRPDNSVTSNRAWQRKHDIAFLLMMLGSILLLLALSTYSPNDPSWSVQGEGTYRNAVGMVGAISADVLFHALGYLAFVLPVLLMIKLWIQFRKRPTQSSFFWLTRSVGLLLTLSSLCVLGDMSIWHGESLPASSGGILGQSILTVFLPLFGFSGTAIIAVALLALGLMLFLEFSWLHLFDSIGGWLLSKVKSTPEKSEALSPAAGLTGTDPHEYSDDDWEPTLYIKTVDEPAFSALNDDLIVQQDTLHIPTLDVDAIEHTHDDEHDIPWHSASSMAPVLTKKSQTVSPESEKIIPIEPLERRESAPSERAQRELQGSLFKDDPLPSISLLDQPRKNQKAGYSPDRLQEMSKLLVQKLADFGVKVEVTAVAPGPVITRFEIQPAPGVKSSKISNLARDLARSMAMVSVRVVEVIPGKSVMGIEVPNENRAIVSLSEVLSSTEYDNSKSPLTLALGHDIAGNPVVTDLAKMPHLLVAGTTGSGKSVGVNAMLLSLLFKSTPDELRLILVDPKMLELSVYEGIPHLLTPVITDMKEAASGLRWSVAEMERRYQLMAALGVRNIAGYNKKVRDAKEAGEPIADPLWRIEQSFETTPPVLEPLPYIVIVIDEFADMMMMVDKKKVEELIARIAQKARAAGIHMILATQRPSVDVITGLIKANVPTRIAFQVSSKIDSRTILDQGGADQLLGHGDMLFMPPGTALPERVHGAFVDDDEVHRVVAEWKKRGAPNYIEEITRHEEEGAASPVEGGDEQDELYDLAVAFVLDSGKCSISSVQRKLRIGYNRAARLVETMEACGVVSSPAHNGSREVLVRSSADY